MTKRKSQQKPFILFLVTGLLGTISYSSELLDNNHLNSIFTYKPENSLNLISTNPIKEKNPEDNIARYNLALMYLINHMGY